MLFSIARVIFACLFILPAHFALAGGLRFFFGISPGLSILCIVPLSLVFLMKEGKKIFSTSVQQLILCFAIFSYFLIRLYSFELGALVSYGCADAANHLTLYHFFISDGPKAYNGFNALYQSWWFFEHALGFETIKALILSLCTALFCLAYIIADFSPRFGLKKSDLGNFILFLLAFIILSESCILPLAHYNQADGYLAHFYSISSVLFVIYWAGNLGLLSLAAGLLACRFSYGLQLPELFFAASLMFAIKSLRSKEAYPRTVYGAGSVLLLIATCIGLSSLITVFSLSGSIVSQSLDNAFAAQIAGIALLITCGFRNSFEFWFLVSASLIQAFWLFATDESEYYFSKLFLYSSLLLAIIALRELPNILKSKISLRAITWISMVSFLVLAQRPYMPSYFERTLATSDYRYLSPLLDPKVKEIIDEVLGKERKTFFRYFTSRWAQYSFFNYFYGVNGNYDSFLSPPGRLDKNSCIFWASNSNDIGRLEKYPAPQAIEWLKIMNQRADSKVVKYQVDWAGRQVLRYICSGDSDMALP